CPLLRFVGRQSIVVDICGEKLNEEYVRTVVTDILTMHQLNAAFWMMAPEWSGEDRPFYTLFVQFPQLRKTAPKNRFRSNRNAHRQTASSKHPPLQRKLSLDQYPGKSPANARIALRDTEKYPAHRGEP